MSEALTRQKEYPTNYPTDAVAILDAMSFTDGRNLRLIGSMSLRSQQYAGDYDGFEVVPPASVSSLAHRFQSIVKRLLAMPNAYVGDIKCGVIEEWDVNGETRDVTRSRRKIDELYQKGIISQTEAKEAHTLLADPLLAGDIKFHILRWRPTDILRGHLTYRGKTFHLKDAIATKGVTKLDVVGEVNNNKYTEFSVIYEFRDEKGRILNKVRYDVVKELRHDVEFYIKKGMPMKALKRKFALAKITNDYQEMGRLQPILNGDLGRLYSVTSDLGTILYLLEHRMGDTKVIKTSLDLMVGRLANVYETDAYLKQEHNVLGEIASALKSPKTQMLPRVRKVYDRLMNVLNESASKYV
jgi:hypothetical protein